jgi:cytochrome P450
MTVSTEPLELQRNPTGFLLRCAQDLGPVADIAPALTLLSDPGDIGFVLRHTGDVFSRTHNFLGEPTTERDPSDWNSGRRAVSVSFRSTVESIALGAIAGAVGRLLADWPLEPVDDGLARFERATSSIIGRICFGREGDRMAVLTGRLLDVLFDISAKRSDPRRWTPIRRRASRCESQLRDEIRALVDDRIRCGSPGEDLAGVLTHPEAGALGSELATRMLVSVMLAGHGVPAVALAWTVFLLDKYPAERRKIADEVRFAAIDSLDVPLPVTEAATREALRLYPPTWLLARKLLHAETLHGRRFQEGHVFYISPFITGRDRTYYHNPRAFVPSRWHNREFKKQLPRYAYFPFGGGSRLCLGQFLAKLELRIMTAMLVKEGNLTVVEPDRVRLSAQRGLRPIHLTLLRNT